MWYVLNGLMFVLGVWLGGYLGQHRTRRLALEKAKYGGDQGDDK